MCNDAKKIIPNCNDSSALVQIVGDDVLIVPTATTIGCKIKTFHPSFVPAACQHIVNVSNAKGLKKEGTIQNGLHLLFLCSNDPFEPADVAVYS